MTRIIPLIVFIAFLSGCAVAKATGKTAAFVGKVGYNTVKITGKTAIGVGKVAGSTARTAVHMTQGTQVVNMRPAGNSFLVDIKINREVSATFLLDTGASQMQISQNLARRLRIDPNRGQPIVVKVAGGQAVSARSVNLKEVRIGRARVSNVPAIVIDREGSMNYDGLLGMSFLNNFNFQINTEKSQLVLRRRY